MSVDFVVRWKWYFEYIAALVKTKNPYCHVILTIGQQNTLCGEDYITTKTISLLRHKKATLEKLKKSPISNDLFDFAKSDKQAKIAKLALEIEALKTNQYEFYVPPVYINKIKQYLI